MQIYENFFKKQIFYKLFLNKKNRGDYGERYHLISALQVR
jgi:hypothetical protein